MYPVPGRRISATRLPSLSLAPNLQGSRALQHLQASSSWRKPQQTSPLVASNAACQPIETIPGQTSYSYKYCLHARACTRPLEASPLRCISYLVLHCLIWRLCPSHWLPSASAKLGPRVSAKSRPSASLATLSPGRLQGRDAHRAERRVAALWHPACGCICMCPTLSADPDIFLLRSFWRSHADYSAAWQRPTHPQPRSPNRSR